MWNISNLAPVSVMVYDRLNHFKRCIESLRANEIASETELYIFSDAARPGDEEIVSRVREFCVTISGFRRVHLKFQADNNYIRNSIEALTIPLLSHGRIISLEDDNLVAQTFLSFMNKALDHFKDNESVLGISGYCPPVSVRRFVDEDVFMSKFYSFWGQATWSHKGYLEYLSQSYPYRDMIRSDSLRKVRSIHPMLGKRLKMIDKRDHFAPDQMLSYSLIKNGLFQVKPVESLVRNIGHDGSGVNCGISSRFDHPVTTSVLDPCKSGFCYIPEIDRMQLRFFYPSLVTKIRRRMNKDYWKEYLGRLIFRGGVK